jgi:chromosome segregation ATPase
MEPNDPQSAAPASRTTNRPHRLDLSVEPSSKKSPVTHPTDSDQEDAPNTPSAIRSSTALVCTTNELPPTPTSAIEIKSCSAGIKRKRVDGCGGDADDDEGHRAKSRFITLNKGGISIDSLLASYITSATEPVYQEQDDLHKAMEDLRTSQANASSKSEADLLALRTQGEGHIKKHNDLALKTKQLTESIATVEKGTSDVRKLHDDTTTKLQQLEQDIHTKANVADVDRRIEKQDAIITTNTERLETLDRKIDNRMTRSSFVVKEKEAQETLRTAITTTKSELGEKLKTTKSELNEKMKTTSDVAEEARQVGAECRLKVEEYRNEANREITDGLKGLNDTLAPLGKVVTAIQGDVTALQLRTDTFAPLGKKVTTLQGEVTALQLLTDNHEKALSDTTTKEVVIDLIAPTRNSLETLEGQHDTLSGNVKAVQTKTDTMQQSIATLDTQAKLFQDHLEVTVPETSGAIKSLTSRVETLEQKNATKAQPTTLTTKEVSPETPAKNSTAPLTLEKLYNWQCDHKKGLTTHDKYFKEDRKSIAHLNSRIDTQNEEIATLKQTREQVEADNKQLRNDFEAEKLRTNQAIQCIQALTAQMAAFQSQMLHPAVNKAPAKPPSESERRRSSQADDAEKKLNERVDTLWNTVVGNDTLANAKIRKVERMVKESDPRISSVERTNDLHEQQISKLRQDMEARFETAIAHSDATANAGFRRNQNAYENALTRSAARIDKDIGSLTNALSTAKADVEARVEEQAEKLKTTDAALGRLDQRVVDLKTDKPLTQAAQESSSASIEALNERVGKSEFFYEAATQASTAASAKLDTLDARMTNLEATYHTAQQVPTTTTSPKNKLDLISLQHELDKVKARCDDIEIGSRNFSHNKKRITALEKKFEELNDAQSAFVAGCVTSEQMTEALEKQISECKSSLEKAIGLQDWHANQRCHNRMEGVKEAHRMWAKEHNQVCPPRICYQDKECD